MTPSSEIAENIIGYTDGSFTYEEAVTAIVVLIDATRKEAIDEDRSKRCADDLYKHSRKLGRLEALEQAAKICEKHNMISCECDDQCSIYLAKELRDLAKEME